MENFFHLDLRFDWCSVDMCVASLPQFQPYKAHFRFHWTRPGACLPSHNIFHRQVATTQIRNSATTCACVRCVNGIPFDFVCIWLQQSKPKRIYCNVRKIFRHPSMTERVNSALYQSSSVVADRSVLTLFSRRKPLSKPTWFFGVWYKFSSIIVWQRTSVVPCKSNTF